MKKKSHFLWGVLSLFWANTYAQSLGTLLVVNKGENTVSIVNLDTNKEVAKVEVGMGPHEVAVSPDGKTAAVCNYGTKTPNNSLAIVDVSQKKNIKTIDLGQYQRPHGIEFIDQDELIVTSEVAQALVKVNIKTDAVTEVVKTNQLTSHMVAYCKADGMAYVGNIRSGSVTVVDVKTSQLIKTIVLKQGTEGLDISPDGKQLWVANRDDSTVTIVNTKTFEKEAILPAHEIAIRVKFLPNGNYALVTNGKTGNVSVYDVPKRKLIKDIELFNLDKGVAQIGLVKDNQHPPVPVGIATYPTGRYVYVAAVGYDLIAVIDTKNWKVVQAIKAGASPDGLYHSVLKSESN